MIFLILSVLIVLQVVLFRINRWFYLIVCTSFFLLGFSRYMVSMEYGSDHISRYIHDIPEKTLIYGTVSGYPEIRKGRFSEYHVFPLTVDKIAVNGEFVRVEGKIMVKRYGVFSISASDKIVIGESFVSPANVRNPGGFDQREYMRSVGISGVLRSRDLDRYMKVGTSNAFAMGIVRVLFFAREKAKKIVEQYVPDDMARSIIVSIIIGARTDIPPELNDLFIRTGTLHILAVSGLHTCIVGLVLLWCLRGINVPWKMVYIISSMGVCLYAVFTGWAPSSLRAAIMTSLAFLTKAIGRNVPLIHALFLSAFIICFVSPGQLFQPGFILSYAAVLAILWLVPYSDRLLNIPSEKVTDLPGKIWVGARRSFSLSLAVWIGMMPIIAFYFNLVTPVVVLANLIAVPVFFVILILGGALICAGSIGVMSFLSAALGTVVVWVINFFIYSLRIFDSVPFSSTQISSPGAGLIAAYYLLLCGCAVIYAGSGRKRIAIIFILFACNLFLWKEIFVSGPPENTRITFFDVGKGDAALIETAKGGVVLIDAGPGGEKGDAGRNIIAPYLRKHGIRSVDCVVVTHPHDDHYGGMDYILDNFDVEMMISPPQAFDVDGGFSDMVNKAKKKKISCKPVSAGAVVSGIPGVGLYVLGPDGKKKDTGYNEMSVVLKAVTDKGNSVLFCADVMGEALKDVAGYQKMLVSDVVKIPHHGGNVGELKTIEYFLETTQSKYVVVSNNDKKYVNKEIMRILSMQGAEICTTYERGAIVFEEGDKLKARHFR